MWFILIPASAVLLLSAVGSYLRVEGRQGTGREAPVTLETGLRAAATLALVAFIGVVVNIIKDTLGNSGFASQLVLQMNGQTAGVSWPTAFIVSVLVIGMTALVLGALAAIWRIVRQD
jgi:hypothetical protein